MLMQKDKNTKVSIEEARKILGKRGENLEDNEVAILVRHLYSLAEIMVDDFLYKKIPEDERKLYNLTAYQSRKKKKSSF